jgi:hypothetical protein
MLPEVLSELVSKQQQKRLADGTHHLLGPEMNAKRLADGTHHLLGGELVRKRVAEGTHNFLGDRNPSHKRVADGTHNFLGGELVRKKIADGTHHFLRGIICIDKQCNNVQVPKEIYHKQKEVTKDQTQWEFAMINSKEGKLRKWKH